MSPLSGAVLGGATVVSAPALWNALVTGSLPLADGLLRWVVALGVCWLGLEIVTALVGPPPPPERTVQATVPTDPAGGGPGADGGRR